MISKNEVKYIQSLYHKKTREDTGLFIAEGPKLLEELLKSSFEIKKIYALKTWIETKRISFPVEEITQAELERISHLSTPNKVLAVVKQKHGRPPGFEGRITLVLDGIQDPGNLGTIMRVADWFGVKNIVASDHTVDVYNPKVIQSTMGSFCRVEMSYGNIALLLSSTRVKKYGAVLNGSLVNESHKIQEGIVVIGSEGEGISPEVLSTLDVALTIPGSGSAESLNAAVAAGIVLCYLTS